MSLQKLPPMEWSSDRLPQAFEFGRGERMGLRSVVALLLGANRTYSAPTKSTSSMYRSGGPLLPKAFGRL